MAESTFPSVHTEIDGCFYWTKLCNYVNSWCYIIPWFPPSARLSNFPWSPLLAFYSSHFWPPPATPFPYSQHVALLPGSLRKMEVLLMKNSLTLWSQGCNIFQLSLPSHPPLLFTMIKMMPHPLANVLPPLVLWDPFLPQEWGHLTLFIPSSLICATLASLITDPILTASNMLKPLPSLKKKTVLPLATFFSLSSSSQPDPLNCRLCQLFCPRSTKSWPQTSGFASTNS